MTNMDEKNTYKHTQFAKLQANFHDGLQKEP